MAQGSPLTWSVEPGGWITGQPACGSWQHCGKGVWGSEPAAKHRPLSCGIPTSSFGLGPLAFGEFGYDEQNYAWDIQPTALLSKVTKCFSREKVREFSIRQTSRIAANANHQEQVNTLFL